MSHLIVFYDGPCALCNYWVQKLCQWDSDDHLRFSSLSDPLFDQFARERNIQKEAIDSLVVWDQQFIYTVESHAVFTLLKRLGKGWRLFLVFSLLPKAWTDALYRLIARNRYRWFGRYPSCPLPHPKYAHKFIR